MPNEAYTRYQYHYKKWHDDTEEHAQAMRRQNKVFLGPHLPEAKDTPILEVGCGMGFALETMKEMGYSAAEGIDLNADQVETCKRKGLRAVQTDDTLQFLNVKKGFYGLVLAIDLVEHMTRDQQISFVKAVYESLRPGGKFLCRVPNASSTAAGRWLYMDLTHQVSFTEQSLDNLLYLGGFEERRVLSAESIPPFPFRRFFGRPVLSKKLWKSALLRLIFRLTRFWRRLEMIAEFGWDEGRSICLSLNILGAAVKK